MFLFIAIPLLLALGMLLIVAPVVLPVAVVGGIAFGAHRAVIRHQVANRGR